MSIKDELYPILSVEEAVSRFLRHFGVLEPEMVPISEALDRVLAEGVLAPMNIPPLANTAMDGYAVHIGDTAGASKTQPKRLKVVANLAAGYTLGEELIAGTAVRIMTGAPIPRGTEAVIPFENVEVIGEFVQVTEAYSHMQNIRPAGEDVQKGDLVLSKGKILRPQEIGMLAALGISRIAVFRCPRVGILSTGDEIIEVDAPLMAGKIHDANGYSNAAQVLKYGGIPIRLGIALDNLKELTAKIQQGLQQKVDLIITSGGVSVGDFDVVKEALTAEGEMTFWRVRMKPGKPLAFGLIQGVPLLGLPGNPVSAMVSFELFARPAILLMQGKTRLQKPAIKAKLHNSISSKDDRRHYLRVWLEKKGSDYLAHLTGDQGSGILRSLVEADGLAIIPEDMKTVPMGMEVDVMMLDWRETDYPPSRNKH